MSGEVETQDPKSLVHKKTRKLRNHSVILRGKLSIWRLEPVRREGFGKGREGVRPKAESTPLQN